jgi:hypothetical protein
MKLYSSCNRLLSITLQENSHINFDGSAAITFYGPILVKLNLLLHSRKLNQAGGETSHPESHELIDSLWIAD